MFYIMDKTSILCDDLDLLLQDVNALCADEGTEAVSDSKRWTSEELLSSCDLLLRSPTPFDHGEAGDGETLSFDDILKDSSRNELSVADSDYANEVESFGDYVEQIFCLPERELLDPGASDIEIPNGKGIEIESRASSSSSFNSCESVLEEYLDQCGKTSPVNYHSCNSINHLSDDGSSSGSDIRAQVETNVVLRQALSPLLWQSKSDECDRVNEIIGNAAESQANADVVYIPDSYLSGIKSHHETVYFGKQNFNAMGEENSFSLISDQFLKNNLSGCVNNKRELNTSNQLSISKLLEINTNQMNLPLCSLGDNNERKEARRFMPSPENRMREINTKECLGYPLLPSVPSATAVGAKRLCETEHRNIEKNEGASAQNILNACSFGVHDKDRKVAQVAEDDSVVSYDCGPGACKCKVMEGMNYSSPSSAFRCDITACKILDDASVKRGFIRHEDVKNYNCLRDKEDCSYSGGTNNFHKDTLNVSDTEMTVENPNFEQKCSAFNLNNDLHPYLKSKKENSSILYPNYFNDVKSSLPNDCASIYPGTDVTANTISHHTILAQGMPDLYHASPVLVTEESSDEPKEMRSVVSPQKHEIEEQISKCTCPEIYSDDYFSNLNENCVSASLTNTRNLFPFRPIANLDNKQYAYIGSDKREQECQQTNTLGNESNSVVSDDFDLVEETELTECLSKKKVGQVVLTVAFNLWIFPVFSSEEHYNRLSVLYLATRGWFWKLGVGDDGCPVVFSCENMTNSFDYKTNDGLLENKITTKLYGFTVIPNPSNSKVRSIVPLFTTKELSKSAKDLRLGITSSIALRPKKNEEAHGVHRNSATGDVQMYRDHQSFVPASEKEGCIENSLSPLRLREIFFHSQNKDGEIKRKPNPPAQVKVSSLKPPPPPFVLRSKSDTRIKQSSDDTEDRFTPERSNSLNDSSPEESTNLRKFKGINYPNGDDDTSNVTKAAAFISSVVQNSITPDKPPARKGFVSDSNSSKSILSSENDTESYPCANSNVNVSDVLPVPSLKNAIAVNTIVSHLNASNFVPPEKNKFPDKPIETTNIISDKFVNPHVLSTPSTYPTSTSFADTVIHSAYSIECPHSSSSHEQKCDALLSVNLTIPVEPKPARIVSNSLLISKSSDKTQQSDNFFKASLICPTTFSPPSPSPSSDTFPSVSKHLPLTSSNNVCSTFISTTIVPSLSSAKNTVATSLPFEVCSVTTTAGVSSKMSILPMTSVPKICEPSQSLGVVNIPSLSKHSSMTIQDELCDDINSDSNQHFPKEDTGSRSLGIKNKAIEFTKRQAAAAARQNYSTKFPLDIICQGRLLETKRKTAPQEEFQDGESFRQHRLSVGQVQPLLSPTKESYPTVRSKSAGRMDCIRNKHALGNEKFYDKQNENIGNTNAMCVPKTAAVITREHAEPAVQSVVAKTVEKTDLICDKNEQDGFKDPKEPSDIKPIPPPRTLKLRNSRSFNVKLKVTKLEDGNANNCDKVKDVIKEELLKDEENSSCVKETANSKNARETPKYKNILKETSKENIIPHETLKNTDILKESAKDASVLKEKTKDKSSIKETTKNKNRQSETSKETSICKEAAKDTVIQKQTATVETTKNETSKEEVKCRPKRLAKPKARKTHENKNPSDPKQDSVQCLATAMVAPLLEMDTLYPLIKFQQETAKQSKEELLLQTDNNNDMLPEKEKLKKATYEQPKLNSLNLKGKQKFKSRTVEKFTGTSKHLPAKTDNILSNSNADKYRSDKNSLINNDSAKLESDFKEERKNSNDLNLEEEIHFKEEPVIVESIAKLESIKLSEHSDPQTVTSQDHCKKFESFKIIDLYEPPITKPNASTQKQALENNDAKPDELDTVSVISISGRSQIIEEVKVPCSSDIEDCLSELKHPVIGIQLISENRASTDSKNIVNVSPGQLNQSIIKIEENNKSADTKEFKNAELYYSKICEVPSESTKGTPDRPNLQQSDRLVMEEAAESANAKITEDLSQSNCDAQKAKKANSVEKAITPWEKEKDIETGVITGNLVSSEEDSSVLSSPLEVSLPEPVRPLTFVVEEVIDFIDGALTPSPPKVIERLPSSAHSSTATLVGNIPTQISPSFPPLAASLTFPLAPPLKKTSTNTAATTVDIKTEKKPHAGHDTSEYSNCSVQASNFKEQKPEVLTNLQSEDGSVGAVHSIFQTFLSSSSQSSFEKPHTDGGVFASCSGSSSTGSALSWTSSHGPVARRDLFPLEDRDVPLQATTNFTADSDEERAGYDSEDDFDSMDAEMRRLEEKLRKFERELGISGDDFSASNITHSVGEKSEETNAHNTTFSALQHLRQEDIDVLKSFSLPEVYPSVNMLITKHLSLMKNAETNNCHGTMDSTDVIAVKPTKRPSKGERKSRSLDLQKLKCNKESKLSTDNVLSTTEKSIEDQEDVEQSSEFRYDDAAASYVEQSYDDVYAEEDYQMYDVSRAECMENTQFCCEGYGDIFMTQESHFGYLWREEDSEMTALDFDALENFNDPMLQDSLFFIFEDDDDSYYGDQYSDAQIEEYLPESYDDESEAFRDDSSECSYNLCDEASSGEKKKRDVSLVSAFKNSFRKAAKYLGPNPFAKPKDDDLDEVYMPSDQSLSQSTHSKTSPTFSTNSDHYKCSNVSRPSGKYNVPNAVIQTNLPYEMDAGETSCSSGEYYASLAVCVVTSDEDKSAPGFRSKITAVPIVQSTNTDVETPESLSEKYECCHMYNSGCPGDELDAAFCITGIKNNCPDSTSVVPSLHLKNSSRLPCEAENIGECMCNVNSSSPRHSNPSSPKLLKAADNRGDTLGIIGGCSHKPTSIKQLKRKKQERIEIQKTEEAIEASGCTFCMGVPVSRGRADQAGNHNRHPSPHPRALPERRTWPPRK